MLPSPPTTIIFTPFLGCVVCEIVFYGSRDIVFYARFSSIFIQVTMATSAQACSYRTLLLLLAANTQEKAVIISLFLLQSEGTKKKGKEKKGRGTISLHLA